MNNDEISEKIIRVIGFIVMIVALEIHTFIEKIWSPDGSIQTFKINLLLFMISLFVLCAGLLIFLHPQKIMQLLTYLNPCRLYNNKKKELVLLLFVCLFCFATLEIIARIMIPEREITKYGWTTPANSTYTVEFDDAPNVTRNITVTYFDFGFKRWGNLSTNKTKVFIVGDSITAMHFVSNEEEWYTYLEKEFPNVEFFVYGSSGYGSLQEYMVLDDFIDVIKPDIILWQFSANDIMNNLYSYEKKNFIYANRAFRPYLEGERIVYKIPLRFGIVRKYSYFLNFLLEKYDAFIFDLEMAKIEHNYESTRRYPEEQQEAVSMTIKIMQMAAKRTGDIPIYFFSSSPLTQNEAFLFPNLDEQEMLLCQAANITCIPGVAEWVNEKEKQGIIVKVADGHWNLAGNKFAGEFLSAYLKKNYILE